MCLKKPISKHKPPLDEIWVGYKVFTVYREGKYHSEFWSLEYNSKEWYKAGDKLIGTDPIYPEGFHIFKNRKDAEMWADEEQITVKVEGKTIVAEGLQPWLGKDMPAFVAKEMKIL